MNDYKNKPREFTDDQLYEVVFHRLKNKHSLKYKDIQNYLINKGEISNPSPNYYSSGGVKILSEVDYLKILEITWNFARAGFILPCEIDGYEDFHPFANFRVCSKGSELFNKEKPVPYSEIIGNLNRESITSSPQEELLAIHKGQIQEAISFYINIKEIVKNMSDLTDAETNFITKEYFKKAWNPLG